MSRDRCRARAFTLLELILATSIAAMLALSLYATMSTAFKARRSAHASLNPVRTAAVVGELIRADLQSIPPPTGILAGPFIGTPVDGPAGRADVLSFYTFGDAGVTDGSTADGNLPDPLRGGMRHVEFELRTDVAPAALVRRVEPNLLAPVTREPLEEVLCSGVASFAVRYFDGSVWTDAWDSTTVGDALPEAVVFLVELQPEEPGAVPARVMRSVLLSCAPAEALTTEPAP